MKISSNLEIGFNLLKILNFEEPRLLRIEQDYYSTPLTNPYLKVSNNQIQIKYFSNVTLLGLEYELVINEIKTQPILIFATPLEHLVGINILLLENSKIIRIEYELKTYLIHESQIEYLQKPFTILEEIEAELFDEFSYITPFSRSISFLLPRNKHKQETIRIVEEDFFDKILFTPHINSLHLHYAINEHIFLYNIHSDKKILSQIHKHLHYLMNFNTSHFEEAQIIELVHTKYPLEVIEEEKDILFHHVSTQYYYKIIPNLELEIITTNKEEFALPCYLNSSLNFFYPFKNSEDFLSKNGVYNNYDLKELQELVVKDENFSILTYTPFFISFRLEQYIKKIISINFYTNPIEYQIITKIIQNNTTNSNFKFPKFSSLKNNDTSQIHLINISLQKIKSCIKNVQDTIINLAQLPKNFELDTIREDNFFMYQFYICRKKLHKLNAIIKKIINIEKAINQKKASYELLEYDIFYTSKLFEQLSNELTSVSNEISILNNITTFDDKKSKNQIYYLTLIIKEVSVCFEPIFNLESKISSNQYTHSDSKLDELKHKFSTIYLAINNNINLSFFEDLNIYEELEKLGNQNKDYNNQNRKKKNNPKNNDSLNENSLSENSSTNISSNNSVFKDIKKIITILKRLKSYLCKNNSILQINSKELYKHISTIENFLTKNNIIITIVSNKNTIDTTNFNPFLLNEKFKILVRK